MTTQHLSPLTMLLSRHTRRREFIKLLGGAAAWPMAAREQQPVIPMVGFLSGRSPAESAGVVAAFRKGLSEPGYSEPQNVTIDFSWAEGRPDRLPALAREFVERPVDVIAAFGESGPPRRRQPLPYRSSLEAEEIPLIWVWSRA